MSEYHLFISIAGILQICGPGILKLRGKKQECNRIFPSQQILPPKDHNLKKKKKEIARLRLITIIFICISPIPRGKKTSSFTKSKLELYWSKSSLVTLNFSMLLDVCFLFRSCKAFKKILI